VCWGVWGFLGKLALRDAGWVQVSLIYGVSVVAMIGVLAVALRHREADWSWKGTWLSAVTGLAGTAGLIAFYLALDRGKASVVVPIVGVYPVLTALLALVFLGERLTSTQAVGVGLALLAVVLISIGR